MKKLLNFLLFSSVLILFSHIYPGIDFGSQNSALQIAAGATFNVGSSNLVIDGTLKGQATSSITGNPIAMDYGVINFENLAVEMFGTFDPIGSDIIRLNGNNIARADAGTVIDEIRVQGTGNSLLGQPRLTYNITLTDAATELTIAIQSTLNKSVDLNGGTLNLGSELTLADNVNINGPGTVDLKKYRLNLGSLNSSFTGPITFMNSTDLTLHGNIVVTSTWTFATDARINGNGCVIDLTNGSFKINPGVTLYLDDVTIIGLHGDSSTGSFIFDSNTSSIRSTNAYFELSADVTISRGRMYIDAESTFLLKNLVWTFNDGPGADKGVLTVNSCLWLDVVTPLGGNICDPTPTDGGELRAPLTIFINHVYSQINVTSNIAAGNLVLASDCRIREVTDLSALFDNSLVSAPITCDVTLSCNVTICPNQQIVVAGGVCDAPLTIDGQGSTVTFTRAEDSSGNPLPQFILERDCSVRLINITFARLNGDTFELKGGSCLYLNQKTTFELIEDIIFGGQELAQPPSPLRRPGRMIVDGPDNVFTIRGIGSRKRFKLDLPDIPTQYIVNGSVISRSDDAFEDPRDGLHENIRFFNLGSNNSLLLENIEFSGLGFMDFVNRRLTNRLTPGNSQVVQNTTPTDVSIVLGGNSAVEVDRDTKMNFDTEFLTNELVFTADALTLYGTVSFLGLAEQNILNMRHMINDSSLFVEDGVLRQRGLEESPFRLGLNGDPGIFLSGVNGSTQAVAGLIFDDSNLEVINGNANAFILDINSFVRSRRLRVTGSPVKQTSSLTDVDDLKKLEGKIDSGFIRARESEWKRPTSAFIRLRDAQRKLLEHTEIPKRPKSAIALQEEKKKAQENKQKLSKPHKLKKNKEDGSIKAFSFIEDNDSIAREIVRPIGNFAPPDNKDSTILMRLNDALDPFVLNKRFIRCNVNDFNHDGARGFNLLLNESTLNQAPGSTINLVGISTARPEPFHVINVQGLKNVINVTGQMIIGKGTLNFDDSPDAEPCELIFNFVDGSGSPSIEFAENTIIKIPKNSRLIFSGKGQVILNNGVEFKLAGTMSKKLDPQSRSEVIDKVEGRAALGFYDRVSLSLANPVFVGNNVVLPKAYITGVGKVRVDSGALLDINNFGSLIVAPNGLTYAAGGNTPNKTIEQLPDDIEIEVRNTGSISVGISMQDPAVLMMLNAQIAAKIITPQTASARILTGAGYTNWRFKARGSLIIRKNGRFEFNNEGVQPDPTRCLLDGRLLTRGWVREFIFTEGSMFFIEKNGLFVLGPNLVINRIEKTFPFRYFPIFPFLTGKGSVEFVGLPVSSSRTGVYTGFAGRLKQFTQDGPEAWDFNNMTMFELAKLLIGLNDNLTCAIEFIDACDDKRKVRTIDGIIVELQPCDILSSDNCQNGDIVGFNGVKSFIIHRDGTRT